jgi:hypothetical protein
MLFKSFTGLTVQEFDDIYDKEIAKRYVKHDTKVIKKERKRSIGTGRYFKMDVKNRFLMLSVYYHLYITYTLAGFLFDLDQSNVCRDIQKIEYDTKMLTNSTKDIQNNQKTKNASGSRTIFSWLSASHRFTEQQIPRPVDRNRRKLFYSGKKKRHTIKNQLMVNKDGYIIHKAVHKKGKRHD